MGKLRRTQILLEPGPHRELVRIARSEGRSVTALVREVVKNYLEQHAAKSTSIERRLEAFERVLQHREEILRERNGEYIDFDFVEALNQARDEQDERNWAILTSSDEHPDLRQG
jgi:hypothetical protein